MANYPWDRGAYCLTINAGPRANVWTDVIDQALWFDVTATDFYGNGRLPNADWGRFLVRSRWESEVLQKTGAEDRDDHETGRERMKYHQFLVSRDLGGAGRVSR